MSSNLTYVTAYLTIYTDTPPLGRDENWRINHFKTLAETGIQLCVYVTPDNYNALAKLSHQYPNIKVMDPIEIQDTIAAKVLQEIGYDNFTLPDKRRIEKDTVDYMIVQSSKMELVQDATIKNPWNSTHFAWIDFSIAYMFNNMEKSQEQLRILGKSAFVPQFFAIPGCWSKLDLSTHYHYYLDNIHWRFCGCFFLADLASMQKFCQAYIDHFPEFVRSPRKLTWEVNYWAILENTLSKDVWDPKWYAADHNELCLAVSVDYLCGPLQNIKSVEEVRYPKITNYYHGSAAYVQDAEGRHWLNTRLINYYFTDYGYYVYTDDTSQIKTKNSISRIDVSGEDFCLNLVDFKEMDDDSIDLENLYPDTYSIGLEDIRLFMVYDQMYFIATNVNFSKTGRNRMIMGKYDPVNLVYSECKRLVPPDPNSYIEKNWIPIVPRKADSEQGLDDLRFIYKWNPMEIGKLTRESEDGFHLEIVESFKIQNPWFDRIRGSTTFLDTEQGFIGLVHFSEERCPREYYHMFLLLDRETLRPIKYSQPFYFLKRSVEFCIGLAKIGSDYVCWVSRMDRDTVMITLSGDTVDSILCENIV